MPRLSAALPPMPIRCAASGCSPAGGVVGETLPRRPWDRNLRCGVRAARNHVWPDAAREANARAATGLRMLLDRGEERLPENRIRRPFRTAACSLSHCPVTVGGADREAHAS